MEDRRIEGNFSQGWGIAGLITLLAVAAFIGAGVINRKTHRAPTDPLAPAPKAAAEGH